MDKVEIRTVISNSVRKACPQRKFMTTSLKPLGMSHSPSSFPVFSRFSPLRLLFPNMKTNLPGRKFGSNEGIIDAVDE